MYADFRFGVLQSEIKQSFLYEIDDRMVSAGSTTGINV